MATDPELADEIVGTIRTWVDRDVVPHVSEFESADEFPQAMFDQMCEFGLFGATIQEEYGGLGLDVTTYARIIEELARPGRDPRQKCEAFSFAEGINKIEDLTVGMKLPGIITNVTAFGAFVDLGVHQDGLIHISQLANKYVSNPADEVKVQQQVWVTVLEVDLERKRIGLSMKG